jgi:hypothetical protein
VVCRPTPLSLFNGRGFCPASQTHPCHGRWLPEMPGGYGFRDAAKS